MTGSPMSEQLFWCLREAQRTGSVGSGALEDHLEQAAGYFASGGPPGGVCVDLGSGGGLPALPLALAYPTTSWTLVEAWERRAALLRRFVRLLELTGRVSVVHDRAERAARGSLRGAATAAEVLQVPPVSLGNRTPVLRETRMPAVQLRIGPAALVGTNLATLAAALVAAVEHWFLEPLEDIHPEQEGLSRP